MAWHKCYSIDNGRAQGLTKTPREHTMKAYESMNTQQVYSDTMNDGNVKLHEVLGRAWDTCDSIDYIPEWGDQNLGVIIGALREYGKDSLADELVAELENVFGESPYRYDFVSFFRLFEEDGETVFEREDGRANMTWPEIKALMDYEGWHAEDFKMHEIESTSLLCVYFRQW